MHVREKSLNGQFLPTYISCWAFQEDDMISSVSAYATYNNQIQENTTKHATNDEDVVITATERDSYVETEQADLRKSKLVSCSEIG